MNEQVREIIERWPKEPHESAERLIEEYGEPNIPPPG
jgi:hypothetical protein